MRDYRELVDRSASLEEFIRAFRDDGLSKVASIKALVDLRQASLSDAKRLIHLSETWADRRAQDDDFHRELFGALDAKDPEQPLDK